MRRLLVPLFVFALTGSSALAQQVEVAASVGRSTSTTLDQKAEGVDELEINGGTTWGARGTWFLRERFGLEALWTHRATELDMSTAGGTAELFEMTINQLHGNVVYQFGTAQARIKPFVLGGLGATFFSADDLDGDVKLTWDVGGGAKWFLWRRFGVEGRVRYAPTELRATSGESCGPFGFCQGTLHNVDVAAAFVARF